MLDALPGDVDELLPAPDERAGELAQEAISKLRDRGEREANELRETLERQRGRVGDELCGVSPATTGSAASPCSL